MGASLSAELDGSSTAMALGGEADATGTSGILGAAASKRSKRLRAHAVGSFCRRRPAVVECRFGGGGGGWNSEDVGRRLGSTLRMSARR